MLRRGPEDEGGPDGLRTLHLVLVSTPIGALGSGRGGGVELTLASLVRGLLGRGHQLTLVAPEGSRLPAVAIPASGDRGWCGSTQLAAR